MTFVDIMSIGTNSHHLFLTRAITYFLFESVSIVLPEEKEEIFLNADGEKYASASGGLKVADSP